ncbi:uncharacterized protein [Triticum aestivum]|uniref:uncharacterized protein isoform X2 n=1 Tax=Triticum aestivum TaxID=4565 RepID=UPI000989BAE2|nr:uncharacterized protein LOC123098481 isoform X2 [Triticum aestivum]XP_045083885.1 uncharacterized protein LOC109752512 isoform X1 [Aegilops tauschii subsp. strangulata]XP_045083886.1 uncharacterized protein LOC109752512 isoform X1 [Aegilops tauschii subsp. strangulata]
MSGRSPRVRERGSCSGKVRFQRRVVAEAARLWQLLEMDRRRWQCRRSAVQTRDMWRRRGGHGCRADASPSVLIIWLCPDEPLCQKHNKPYEYIHRPHKANSIQKFKGKKIHVKPRKYILRGEPCIHYLDEFSHHIVWGNTVKLYNHNVRTLQKIIRSTTTPDNYYVCHMTETFATQGKRMYFSVPFSMGSLFPHMDVDHGELPITTGDGTITVTARFIKGVDKRATITKGWSDFFCQAHMNEGQVYAFAFKCTSKGLCLIIYSI